MKLSRNLEKLILRTEGVVVRGGPGKKRHKYNAVRTEANGITFDSKKEAKRYGELLLLQRVGKISGLELQPEFPITVNGEKITTYRGDFKYREAGMLIIEDVKGMRTREFIIKARLVHACYGVVIRET